MNPVFNVVKKSEEVSEITILGEIGESWFSEGYTMHDAKAELDSIKTPKIVLNISSPGGRVSDALVIHDFLKAKKADIEVRMFGVTASSGTVIAMAGKKEGSKITMSENALFLVHNASMLAAGNAKEMREAADMLDIWDQKIINIYKSVTGKPEQEIRDLMQEEKWIDATEAKEWGFVSEIFQPDKIAAHYKIDYNKINNSHLPKINIMAEENKNIFSKIEDMFNKIMDNFKDKPEPEIQAIQDELTDIKAKYTQLENDSTAAKTASDALIAQKDADIQAKQAEIETLKNENDKIKTAAIKIDGDDPDARHREGKEITGNEAAAAKNAAELKTAKV